MAETTITKIVDVQTNKAVTNIRDLKKEIRDLKDYLSRLDNSSAEYTKTLNKLNQYETQLNNAQKVSAQNTQNLANQLSSLSKIGSGLAGGFSALNGVLALLGKSGDDLGKVLVKLQGGIAVVQGVGGLQGLAESLPKIKGWFDNIADTIGSLFDKLDPFNKRVSESATALNNLNTEPLAELGKIGDISVSASSGLKETNNTLQQQAKTIVPVNEQWDTYIKKQEENLKKLKDFRENTKQSIDIIKQQKDSLVEIEKVFNEAVESVDKLEKAGKSQSEAVAEAQSHLNKQLSEMGYTLDEAVSKLEEYAKGSVDLGIVEEELEGQLKNQEKAISNTEKAIRKAEFAQTKFGKAVQATKSALSTVGWTVLITAIVTAVYKLGEYIVKLYKAANAQRELTKEINKSASEIAGKSVGAFKELLSVYNQFSNKSEFLKEYSEQIEATGLKINSVKDAEDAFVKNTEAYQNAIIARAQIDAYRQKITEKTKEYIDNQLEIERKGEEDLQKAITEAGIYASGASLETIRTANQAQTKKALKENEDDFDKFAKRIFKKIEDLQKAYKPFWATKDTGDGASASISDIVTDLETLNNYFLSSTEKQVTAVDKEYQEMLALAEKYGIDTTAVEEEYLKRKEDILAKSISDTISKEKEGGKSRYDQFKEELARIRQLSDTSNLVQTPQEHNTRYGQKASRLFGGGFDRNEVFTYQSKEDIETTYAEQVKYNNQIYELTRQRVEAENALLEDQLTNSELTADQRLEIERTLKENLIALSDAEITNEKANAKAYDDVQSKKRQALQATLSVASSVAGSIASIAQTEYQNEEKSEKERKAAFVTYKAAATTQAIMDTYAAANSSYQSMASIPYVGPVLGAAAAAAAIASGIANVVSIQRTQFNSSTSSVSASSVTPPSISQPDVTYTRNLLGDKEVDTINSPIKVYVTEKDITSVQNKVKVTQDNATF